MAGHVVFRGSDGQRRIVTDKERAEAKRVTDQVDAHNQKRDRLAESRFREDIDSATKDTVKRIIKGTRYFT